MSKLKSFPGQKVAYLGSKDIQDRGCPAWAGKWATIPEPSWSSSCTQNCNQRKTNLHYKKELKLEKKLSKIEKQSFEQQQTRFNLTSLFWVDWLPLQQFYVLSWKWMINIQGSLKITELQWVRKKERLCTLYLSSSDIQCVYNRDNSWSNHRLLLRKKNTICITVIIYPQKLIIC